MIGAATLRRRSAASPAPEPSRAPAAAELAELVGAARALLRVDDLHLDNRAEKAALRDALARHRGPRA